MLKINFGKVGSGAQKIDRGEFVIQDASSRRQIDLYRDWDTVFQPGQRVDMSMVFHTKLANESACPGCSTTISRVALNEIVDCQQCGMAFSHHVLQQNQFEPSVSSPSVNNLSVSKHQAAQASPRPPELGPGVLKRKREHEANDEMRLYRRIRVINQVKDLSIYNVDWSLVPGREVAFNCSESDQGWIQGVIISVNRDARPTQYGFRSILYQCSRG